jgi:hypothetical protein
MSSHFFWPSLHIHARGWGFLLQQQKLRIVILIWRGDRGVDYKSGTPRFLIKNNLIEIICPYNLLLT